MTCFVLERIGGPPSSQNRLGSLDHTAARARALAEDGGGYVERSSVVESGAWQGGRALRRVTLELRVEVARFEAVLAALKALVPAADITRQETHTRDVTVAYAEGAARHAGLLASHAQLLQLMSRADQVHQPASTHVAVSHAGVAVMSPTNSRVRRLAHGSACAP